MKKTLLLFPTAILVLLSACHDGKTTDKTDTDSTNTPAAYAARPLIADQGVNIVYDDTGKGDTTLLFVHGWAINRSYWADQVDHFKGRYRVVTIDLPGYGESGKNRSDWSVTAFGRDVDSVMERLNLQQVILVGHSMSGDIIVEAALHAPGRVIGLVGVDNFKGFGGPPQTKAQKEEYTQAIAAMKQHFQAVTTQYFNQALFYKTTDSAIRKRILNDVFHSDSAIAIATMASQEYKEADNLAATKMKLHLVNSDVTPTDTMGFHLRHIPIQVEYVHATGHYPMVEKPGEFNAALERAIAKL